MNRVGGRTQFSPLTKQFLEISSLATLPLTTQCFLDQSLDSSSVCTCLLWLWLLSWWGINPPVLQDMPRGPLRHSATPPLCLATSAAGGGWGDPPAPVMAGRTGWTGLE